MTHKIAVSAGRYDRSVDQVAARIARARKLGAVMYLSTEVMRDQRAAFAQVKRAGWKVVFRGEYALAWDPAAFTRVGRASAWLEAVSTALFRRGSRQMRAQVAGVRLRDNASRRVGVYEIGHLPAHLQDGNGYSAAPYDRPRVRAHQQALAAAGRRARRRAEAHPDWSQLWCGDVNVDLFKPVWRGRLRDQLRPLEPVWRADRLPASGDLGARLITGAWTWQLTVRDAVVLGHDAGSDHDLVLLEVSS